MKKRYAPFGSISTNTMRPCDLIPDFAAVLREYRGALPKGMHGEISKLEKGWERRGDDDAHEANMLDDLESGILDDLFDALDEFAPPYGYFGAHPGDGADYGFWLNECFEHDFDGLKVNDTSEVPKDYSGEVLHVNDHGNCTLYVARKGKLREIWAVV